jgi:GDP-L-fucose synthase
MQLDDPVKILVTGGNSMVGKHLRKIMPNAVYITSQDCNLTDPQAVDNFFRRHQPNVVVHLAAKVGGILDNIRNPIQFFEDNVLMNLNTLKSANRWGCRKFIGILSTCIYPDSLPANMYPLPEYCLHDGPPTPTNFSYGYAKRCLAVQIDSYNKQLNTEYNYLIPCNLYSEYDHFVGEKAHFVSSLIHKISSAKKHNHKDITLFGSGQPLRQFMYAEDLAVVIKTCIKEDITANMNVASPEVYSIKQMANIAIEACDATDLTINWDSTKPDGQFRKDVSIERLNHAIPIFAATPLFQGIQKTFRHYHGLET